MSLRAFGKQPEGFWRPVRAHMGPARKRLVLKAAPAEDVAVLGLPSDPLFHE